MYAVFETGGKQYRAEPGQRLKIEKLEAAIGDVVEFDRVLLVEAEAGYQVGRPMIDGGKVTGEVIAQGRHDKVHILKFRRRKHHMKRNGHRQYYTEVRITGITTTS